MNAYISLIIACFMLTQDVRGATSCNSNQYFGEGDAAVGIVCSGGRVSATRSFNMVHKAYVHIADIPKGAKNLAIKTTVGTGNDYRRCDIDTLLMRDCSSNDASCYNQRYNYVESKYYCLAGYSCASGSGNTLSNPKGWCPSEGGPVWSCSPTLMKIGFSGDDLGNCDDYGPNGKGVESVEVDVVNEPLKLFVHVWSAGGVGKTLATTVTYSYDPHCEDIVCHECNTYNCPGGGT